MLKRETYNLLVKLKETILEPSNRVLSVLEAI